MDHQINLGIYLAKNAATAVLLKTQTGKPVLVDCFTAITDPAQDNQPGSLAALLARTLSEKNHSTEHIFVSLDSTLFTQHNLHSDFTEYRQIAGTIKFDAEEAAAADATQLAIAFMVTASDKTGSDVSVFTADRTLMTQILADFQAAGLDPIVIEPDIVCLDRFARCAHALPQSEDSLLVVLSGHTCYMSARTDTQYSPVVRSFLFGSSGDRTSQLARQIQLTVASAKGQRRISSVVIDGSTEQVNPAELSGRIQLEVKTFDFFSAVESQEVSAIETGKAEENCPSGAAFAIACGAAITGSSKTAAVDFRADFAPYQGRRLIFQKTLRMMSISLTILVLAVGIYFQSRVWRNTRDAERVWTRLETAYSEVMYGKKPAGRKDVVNKLKSELVRTKKAKEGLLPGDENSILARLTFIFEAINNSPRNIDLRINDISITNKTIRMTGDTNSRASTLQLFDALQKHPKLRKSNETLNEKAGRDTFSVNLEPK